MTNVEKIQKYSSRILGDIRQRIGATDGNDTSCDSQINQMTPRQLTRAYTGWQLGDEGWADDIIDLYESLKK